MIDLMQDKSVAWLGYFGQKFSYKRWRKRNLDGCWDFLPRRHSIESHFETQLVMVIAEEKSADQNRAKELAPP